MPIPKTVKPKTPCKTCYNREQDEDYSWFCGRSGKDIRDGEASEFYEDDNAFCVNHAKRAPDWQQKPG